MVVRSQTRRDRSHSYWLCLCDCGGSAVAAMSALRRGLVVSCGCFRRESASERSRTHGRTGTAEYGIWCAMKRRCSNPNVPEWKNYGGRGISVCARWHKFENFLADMGERPLGLSLDRIDNDGNYEPSNCRWAPRVAQARNARNNRVVELDGRKVCLAEACEIRGIPYRLVNNRISKGWPESLWFEPKMRSWRGQ